MAFSMRLNHSIDYKSRFADASKLAALGDPHAKLSVAAMLFYGFPQAQQDFKRGRELVLEVWHAVDKINAPLSPKDQLPNPADRFSEMLYIDHDGEWHRIFANEDFGAPREVAYP